MQKKHRKKKSLFFKMFLLHCSTKKLLVVGVLDKKFYLNEFMRLCNDMVSDNFHFLEKRFRWMMTEIWNIIFWGFMVSKKNHEWWCNSLRKLKVCRAFCFVLRWVYFLLLSSVAIDFKEREIVWPKVMQNILINVIKKYIYAINSLRWKKNLLINLIFW
jgi:hypothetical protein